MSVYPDIPERWIVRLVVTREFGDAPPTEWDWDLPGADVVVLSGEPVGLIAPEMPDEEGGGMNPWRGAMNPTAA